MIYWFILRHRAAAPSFSALLLLAVLTIPARATREVAVPASSRGYYASNVDFTGPAAPDGAQSNYIVGNDPDAAAPADYRDFFVFPIADTGGGIITAARLQLSLPTNGYLSLQRSVPYELHSVGIDPGVVASGTANDSSIFNALGDGGLYGNTTVKSSDAGRYITIPLNASFVSAADAAQGASIAIGGVLPVSDNSRIFAATQFVGSAGLYLTIQDAPSVTTLSPSNVASTTAIFRARVNPNGVPSTVTFMLDGTAAGSVPVKSGTDDVVVTLGVSGLSPNAAHMVEADATAMNGALHSKGAAVSFDTALAPPPATALDLGGTTATTSAIVPGAGTFPGITSGATFAAFGLPSIAADGSVAFAAKLSGKPSLTAIFGPAVTGTFGPLALIGGSVPGLTGATYVAFTDPVAGGPAVGTSGSFAFGRVAFAAQIKGPGIPRGSTAFLSTASSDGTLAILAQTGQPVLGMPVSAVLSYAMDGAGNPSAVVRFATGNGVNGANSIAFVQWIDGAPSLLVRQGDSILIGGTQKTIASISALIPSLGSAGAARGPLLTGSAVPDCRVSLTDGSQAILRTEALVEAYTGQQAPGGNSGKQYLTFGQPVGGPVGGFQAYFNFSSTVKRGRNAALITPLHDGSADIIPQYVQAPIGIYPVSMALFTDPVGCEDNGAAFITTLVGNGVTPASNKAIVWVDADGLRHLLARTGDPAPGIPSCTVAKLNSVALPSGYHVNGPIFTGNLALGHGVTAGNSTVLWGCIPAGDGFSVITDKLLRTGDIVTIAGQPETITGFTVLQGARGSLAQPRGYNAQGQIAVLATFKDHGVSSQSVLELSLP